MSSIALHNMQRFANRTLMAIATAFLFAMQPPTTADAGPPAVLPAGHEYAVQRPIVSNQGVPLHSHAAPPRYLLLETDHSAVGQPVRAGSYAYGWFGVSPRQHYSSHRGYYGDAYHWRGRIAP